MNPILGEVDRNDPAVLARIRRQERIAKECQKLIATRFRKQQPEQLFESYANTIGILSAELVRDGYQIGGRQFAKAMADMVQYHVEATLALITGGDDQ